MSKCFHISSVLANGATVLAIAESGDFGIVLAHYAAGTHPQEWITWMYRTDERSTFWGHYFSTHQEAVDDYQKRVIENLWPENVRRVLSNG